MAGAAPSQKGPIAAINITPLVDVILVLLIIFMVTTEVVREDDKVIGIELPIAASSDNKQVLAPFTVVVTSDGKFIKDGEPVDEAAVIASAKQLVVQKGAAAEAVVAADKAASHERFVGLLDILRQAGISRFAIQTDVPEEQQ